VTYYEEESIVKILIYALLVTCGFSGAALSAPGDEGQGIGGCIDSLYGNATNPRPDGNGVLPSQSPGPWVNTGFNEPPRNDRERGPSVGNVNEFLRALGFNVQEFCDEVETFP
jgi:hypothetical protein